MKPTPTIATLLLSLTPLSVAANPPSAYPDGVSAPCGATAPRQAAPHGYGNPQRSGHAQPGQPEYSQHCRAEQSEANGNIVTRTVQAAKQQAEAEVHFEARRRVRGLFNDLFDR